MQVSFCGLLWFKRRKWKRGRELRGTRTKPLANPTAYPGGDDYGTLLRWHLKEWGTDPTVTKQKNGPVWEASEFANKIADNRHEGDLAKNIRRWMTRGSAPPNEWYYARRIQEVLFFDEVRKVWNPDISDWADELWAARAKYYGNQIDTASFKSDASEMAATSMAYPSQIPMPSPHFIGRDRDRDQIIDMILAGKTRAVVIRGGPGIGKTELIKAVALAPAIVEHFGVRRWFVSLENAGNAQDVMNAITQAVGQAADCDFINTENSVSKKSGLLILDNFETPWSEYLNRKEINNLLYQIYNNSNIYIVCSMRGVHNFESINCFYHEVQCLDGNHSSMLFSLIAGEWVSTDPNLKCFIDSLGGIPLAIKLVAQRAHGRKYLLPLWNEWLRTGTDFAKNSDHPEGRLTSLNHSIALSLNFNELNGDPLMLLRYIACSRIGLFERCRVALMGTEGFTAEDCLIRSGLAFEGPSEYNVILFGYNSLQRVINVLPPIREYILRHTPPSHSELKNWMTYFDSINYRLANVSSEGESKEDFMYYAISSINAQVCSLLNNVKNGKFDEECLRVYFERSPDMKIFLPLCYISKEE